MVSRTASFQWQRPQTMGIFSSKQQYPSTEEYSSSDAANWERSPAKLCWSADSWWKGTRPLTFVIWCCNGRRLVVATRNLLTLCVICGSFMPNVYLVFRLNCSMTILLLQVWHLCLVFLKVIFIIFIAQKIVFKMLCSKKKCL